MALRLADGVRDVVELTQEPRVNSVFAILPEGMAERLQRSFKFYVWNEHTREVRWMCSWDTSEADVDAIFPIVSQAEFPKHMSWTAHRDRSETLVLGLLTGFATLWFVS